MGGLAKARARCSPIDSAVLRQLAFSIQSLEPATLFFNLAALQSVLCIGAHPDDIEIGCGGTLLSLLKNNPRLRLDWVVMGCNAERNVEANEAFQAWSDGRDNCHIHLFDFEDTLFPSHITDIRKELHKLSGTINPDLIFTHRREDLHQDHRTLAEVTWNAFRQHLILEYEIPKYEGDLGNPNVFMPLDREIAEQKVALLMTHFPSQQLKPWYRKETFEAIMRIRGLESKAESGFAEAFHGRKILLATDGMA